MTSPTPIKSIGKIPTTVSYLEMNALPLTARELDAQMPDLKINHVKKPSVAFYRELYDRVGKDYTWTGRKLLSDTELEALIHHPDTEVHVLNVANKPAGYVEFDLRNPKDVEIVYFGMFPEFYGKGFGTLLLKWAIHYIWNIKKPNRLWLHTCTLDHPRMLPMYLKAGFTKYREQTEFVDQIE